MNKLLLIEVHFHFATTLSQCCNCKKGVQINGLDLMVVYPRYFAHVKQQP
jgi:hypothetical protein